jgi:hypothetical protein
LRPRIDKHLAREVDLCSQAYRSDCDSTDKSHKETDIELYAGIDLHSNFIYFPINCGAYALSFCPPTMIKALGIASIQQIGLYAMIPYAVGSVALIFNGRHSYKTGERRWHLTAATLISLWPSWPPAELERQL